MELKQNLFKIKIKLIKILLINNSKIIHKISCQIIIIIK